MTRTIQHYGWRRSLPDFRDFKADTTGLTVAAEVDPRSAMPPIYNQGQLGSCTANAVAGAMQYDLMLDGDPATLHRPSRLFLYYMERMIEGSLGQGDTGAEGHDGFKALAKYGWVPEREWRYDIGRFQIDPPAPLWTEAATRVLTKQYVTVSQDQASMQSVLSNSQTIAMGFTVYESFESNQVAETGIVPMPGRNESTVGGHEVLIIGYLTDQPDYALCRNSWGTDWGMNGYFLMPWEYVLNADLASDFRTIVRTTT